MSTLGYIATTIAAIVGIAALLVGLVFVGRRALIARQVRQRRARWQAERDQKAAEEQARLDEEAAAAAAAQAAADAAEEKRIAALVRLRLPGQAGFFRATPHQAAEVQRINQDEQVRHLDDGAARLIEVQPETAFLDGALAASDAPAASRA